MKTLFQFYYLPAPTSKQARVLVYAGNYEEAVKSVKKVLRLDYGRDGKSKLIKQGDRYRHDQFADITAANNQLGPGRSIISCLPPSQMLAFLQDYAFAMTKKSEEGVLRRGESEMLRSVKALLREKQAEREAEARVEEFRRKKGFLRKQHLGKATGEHERPCDVARDW